MAKSYDVDTARLCEAMQRSRLALRRPRETVREIARQVVGARWSEEGSPQDVIVNLLSVYQTVIGRTLIPHNPRVMFSTFDRSIKPTVFALERWANKQIEHIDLKNTLRRIVTNALYSFGIAKVALATPAQSAAAAWNLRAGEVTVSSIDLDDYVCDIHARDFSEFSFEGHRYRVPFAAIKDSKLYAKWRDQLSPTYDPLYNLEGDERVSALGRTMYAADSEEFMPMVDLWEVYLPRQRLIVTLAEDQLTGPAASTMRADPLRIQSWVGPDRGPFIKLGFSMIPGNWMPKGPMLDLVDLHMANNRTMRKLVKTIERMKEVTLVRNGMDQDGNALMKANDGDMIGVSDPTSTTQIVSGGQHAQILVAMATTFKDLFSYVGGNIELIGGRGPQSRTATQDRMLDENANAGVADLQQMTIDFTSDILRSLAWFWWHDPKKVMKVKHSVPGLPEMETMLKIHPAGTINTKTGKPASLRRNGDFEDLDISCDPYSLQHSSPQKKLQDLNSIMQTIVIPLMQLLVQQGKSVDIDAYLQKVAAWMDQPDLQDIITIQEPPQDDQEPSLGDKPRMAGTTNREYTRHNISQRTPQSDNQQLVAKMLGGSVGGDHSNTRNGQMVGQ